MALPRPITVDYKSQHDLALTLVELNTTLVRVQVELEQLERWCRETAMIEQAGGISTDEPSTLNAGRRVATICADGIAAILRKF